MDNFFNFNGLRKTTIQFLNIFNNIKVAKYNSDGSIKEYVKVPLKYAPKEKFYYWLYERKHEVRLPMMSAYITSIMPSMNERGTNKHIKIMSCDGTVFHKALIPYTVEYELSISTLFHNEIDQIFEQIIPYFSPYVMTRINLPEIQNHFDCKVILNSVSPEMDTEIPEDNYRTINWKLNFTVHTYALQPINESKYIEEIFLQIKDKGSDTLYETLHLSGYKDESGNILSTFEIIKPLTNTDTSVPEYPEFPDYSINYLTMGENGEEFVSANSEIWRQIDTSFNDTIVSVQYCKDRFIGATENGKVLSSDDGETWTLIATIDNVKRITKMSYSNGYYIIVGSTDLYEEGNDGAVWYSKDSLTWTRVWEDGGGEFTDCCIGAYYHSTNDYKDMLLVGIHDTETSSTNTFYESDFYEFPNWDEVSGMTDLKCIAWGNNRFVVAGSDAKVATSEGSERSWNTPIQVGDDPSVVWRHIEFVGPEFIMTGDGGYVTRSTDGINWSTPVSIYPSIEWKDVVRENDIAVLVGNDGKITTSQDYVNWTQVKEISTNDFNSVAFARKRDIDDEILYGVNGSNYVYSSLNFKNWDSTGLFLNVYFYKIAYGNGIYVVIGQKGYISRSTDGVNWSPVDTIIDEALIDVQYINGKFYIVSYSGFFYVSTDGIDWTYVSDISSETLAQFNPYYANTLASDGDQYFMAPYGQYYYISTNAGQTWTKTLYSSGYWQAIAFGNGTWVMAGQGGRMAYRTNTTSWVTTYPGGAERFDDVVFGNGVFIAASSLAGKFIRSTNGINWTVVNTSTAGGAYRSLTYNEGKFIASNDNYTTYSEDGGLTWSIPVYDTSLIIGVVYANDIFTILKRDGTILQSSNLSTFEEVHKIGVSLSFRKFIHGYTISNSYGRYVYGLAVGDGGYYSYLNAQYGWEDPVPTSTFIHDWIDGVYANYYWTLIGSDGAIVSSLTTHTWEWETEILYPGKNWKAVSFLNGLYVVIGNGGWILRTFNPKIQGTPFQHATYNWISVSNDGEKFVILSDNGYVSNSTDGINWSVPIYVGMTNTLKIVCDDHSNYVILANGGYVISSRNLEDWNSPLKVGTSIWKDIVYGKQKFILSCDNNLALSQTGTYWIEYSTLTNQVLSGVGVGKYLDINTVRSINNVVYLVNVPESAYDGDGYIYEETGKEISLAGSHINNDLGKTAYYFLGNEKSAIITNRIYSDFTFEGDFTWEMIGKFKTYLDYGTIFSISGTGGFEIDTDIDRNGVCIASRYVNWYIIEGLSVPTNEEIYFAISRENNIMKVSINGIIMAEAEFSGTFQAGSLGFAADSYEGGSYGTECYMRSLRITNGVARDITYPRTYPLTFDVDPIIEPEPITDLTDYGPGPGIESLRWDETTQTGFFGVVPDSEFITPLDLTNALFDQAVGTTEQKALDRSIVVDDLVMESGIKWYKYKVGNKILYIPSSCIGAITWSTIYMLGAMFGEYADEYVGENVDPALLKDKIIGGGRSWIDYEWISLKDPNIPQTASVTIDGKNYRVRLIKGLSPDAPNSAPELAPYSKACQVVDLADCPNNAIDLGVGSEWNDLIYRTFDTSDFEDCAEYGSGWGGNAYGEKWYYDNPNIEDVNSYYTLTLDLARRAEGDYRFVVRGGTTAQEIWDQTTCGWRPVLVRDLDLE